MLKPSYQSYLSEFFWLLVKDNCSPVCLHSWLLKKFPWNIILLSKTLVWQKFYSSPSNSSIWKISYSQHNIWKHVLIVVFSNLEECPSQPSSLSKFELFVFIENLFQRFLKFNVFDRFMRVYSTLSNFKQTDN